MFTKGQSGNPGGRAKKTEAQRQFEEKCQEWCRLWAFDKLRNAADSNNEKRADWALEVMLDRGFGKAMQVQQIDADVNATPSSSPSDLAREVAELLGAATPPSGQPPSQNPVEPAK